MKRTKKICILFLLIIYFITPVYGGGKTEKTGDILTILIPAIALGTTVISENTESQMEFYKAYGSTFFLTHTLKETVREQRPNASNSHTSFPSGHASSAFSGATFIHKKYGLQYAIPAYLGAIYTGYSRVYAKKHYIHDVIAGAILGSSLTWYFTTKKQKLAIIPTINTEQYSLLLSYKW